MPLTPITINDFKVGLNKYQEQFLLLNDAFPQMENIYNWRGRIKRRSGFVKLGTSGRLRRALTAQAAGTVDMSSQPTATYNIFTGLGVIGTEPNANIEIGSLTNIQVTIQGSVTNAVLDITTATQNFTITTPGTPNITAATLDYSTGLITITHTVNDLNNATVTLTLAYYPALPAMGLLESFLPSINVEGLTAFDTKYAYIFDSSGNNFKELHVGTTWTGTDINFFMGVNYYRDNNLPPRELFWVTNFSSGDPIRYSNTVAWIDFLPVINGTNELHKCRFLVPYKGRLLAFNTFEGATLGASIQYHQRLRYSQNGDPTDQVNGWLDDVAGRGGFIDCPTNEHIISFGFIRDQLIIGMERSIWAVRYTGNEILPFIWEKINSEFGWESMRSPVLFDQGVVGVGKESITVCDGVNVQRIDEEIPDEVFKIHNENGGIERVAGIRDYDQEVVYWSFSQAETNATYPNRMFVYNYRNQGWSIFKDSYTCFGKWQRSSDVRWQDLTDITWEEYDNAWNAALNQSHFPNLAGGNQQGYVHVLNQSTGNEASLYITSLTSGNSASLNVKNHNLETGDFIKISGIIGTASALNGVISKISVLNTNEFTIDTALTAGFTYFGGGEVERFSNFSLKSKKFNALEMGKSLSLAYIDFQSETTSNGEFTCNILADYSETPINDGSDAFFNTVVETNLKSSFDIAGSEKVYYRFYCGNHARFSQFELTLSDAQMIAETINKSAVKVDNITLWVSASGRVTS